MLQNPEWEKITIDVDKTVIPLSRHKEGWIHRSKGVKCSFPNIRERKTKE